MCFSDRCCLPPCPSLVKNVVMIQERFSACTLAQYFGSGSLDEQEFGFGELKDFGLSSVHVFVLVSDPALEVQPSEPWLLDLIGPYALLAL